MEHEGNVWETAKEYVAGNSNAFRASPDEAQASRRSGGLSDGGKAKKPDHQMVLTVRLS
jgi:hypothetical protein